MKAKTGHTKKHKGQKETGTTLCEAINRNVMQMQSKYDNEEQGTVNTTHKAYKDVRRTRRENTQSGQTWAFKNKPQKCETVTPIKKQIDEAATEASTYAQVIEQTYMHINN